MEATKVITLLFSMFIGYKLAEISFYLRKIVIELYILNEEKEKTND